MVGIAAAATTADGRWLMIKRADTGTWALPGGTLEWGETLRAAHVPKAQRRAILARVQPLVPMGPDPLDTIAGDGYPTETHRGRNAR